MDSTDGVLDPRIQIELESLNTATDDINKLEIELEEANSTFRILLNESTRRLKLLSKKLGNCIEKARPFYEAQEKARLAQIECQAATVQFQRANEIYAAAKETVALAEQRFMSNSHEWQFDNAWQEMLNHATIKVMDAEKQKTDSHAEHHRKADIFSAAELKVSQLEDRLRRNIQKSRPYFEEKQICQDQLQTQKDRIQELQGQIQCAKRTYSTSLKNLEQISEEIHKMRGDLCNVAPSGPREPGVGAEQQLTPTEELGATMSVPVPKPRLSLVVSHPVGVINQQQTTILLNSNVLPILDFASELEKCEYPSLGNTSIATSSAVSERGDNDDDDYRENIGAVEIITNDDIEIMKSNGLSDNCYSSVGSVGNCDDLNLEELRQKVKVLAVRPVEGGDGQQTQDVWETELNETVNKLDRLMMLRESELINNYNSNSNNIAGGCSAPVGDGGFVIAGSLPSTPNKISPSPIKMLQKADPLPGTNVSMRELPLLARISNEIAERTQTFTNKRRLSLE